MRLGRKASIPRRAMRLRMGFPKREGGERCLRAINFLLALHPGNKEEALRLDSRRLGWVPRGHIAGKAVVVWWPLPRVRRVR